MRQLDENNSRCCQHQNNWKKIGNQYKGRTSNHRCTGCHRRRKRRAYPAPYLGILQNGDKKNQLHDCQCPDRHKKPDNADKNGKKNKSAEHTDHTSNTTSLVFHTGSFDLDATITAITFLIGKNAFKKVERPKIRPQGFGDPYLRICDLPQQKVAHSHFATRADE